MKNRTVLITGATSGIGKETALALARRGAKIVFTSRDASRGSAVRDALRSASGNADVHMMLCDLGSFNSIRRFCSEFNSTCPQLHVLINNAGTWDFTRRESRDGIENMLATNYLAPFLMTNLLLDKLMANRPARIISTSSGLHFGGINFEDLEFKENFSGFRAYRQSKLAILLFTRLLAKRLEEKGITVNCTDPGMVATNLSRDAPLVPRMIFRIFGKAPARGAESCVFLAASEEASAITGECFSGTALARTSRGSKDLNAAKRLWEISEHFVGRLPDR